MIAARHEKYQRSIKDCSRPVHAQASVGALWPEDRALHRRLVLPFPVFRLRPPRGLWCAGELVGACGAVEDDAVQFLQTIGEVERLSVGEPNVEGVLVARLEVLELLWR